MLTVGQPAAAAVRAFPELLRAHQAMVFSIAYHFIRDPGSAEEIAQDVFLQLFRNLEKLESEAHVVHWLRKATSNRCIDFVRKRKMQVSMADVPEPSAPAQSGDLLLSQKLRKLIASLPEKSRMMMVLRYQEDLMPEEIAGILDMPVSTVKSQLQRALALMRAKIARQGETK
jgi:RNA polymerase sigma-70 factor, ECF subfamily